MARSTQLGGRSETTALGRVGPYTYLQSLVRKTQNVVRSALARLLATESNDIITTEDGDSLEL